MTWFSRRHPGGDAYEKQAEGVLRKAGLRVLERNAATREGEIDLIAEDPADDAIVFVEVKGRRHSDHGHASEAVTGAKQRKLVRLAEAWLAKSGIRDRAVRFDVVAIDGSGPEATIEHIVDAFGRN